MRKPADGQTAPVFRQATSCNLGDKDAECGIDVQHSQTDLELRDLAVEVPDAELLLNRVNCRVVLKPETARAGGHSLPLNVRFCFRKQRASQVSFHYLINCGKQTWLLSIGAQ